MAGTPIQPPSPQGWTQGANPDWVSTKVEYGRNTYQLLTRGTLEEKDRLQLMGCEEMIKKLGEMMSEEAGNLRASGLTITASQVVVREDKAYIIIYTNKGASELPVPGNVAAIISTLARRGLKVYSESYGVQGTGKRGSTTATVDKAQLTVELAYKDAELDPPSPLTMPALENRIKQFQAADSEDLALNVAGSLFKEIKDAKDMIKLAKGRGVGGMEDVIRDLEAAMKEATDVAMPLAQTYSKMVSGSGSRNFTEMTQAMKPQLESSLPKLKALQAAARQLMTAITKPIGQGAAAAPKVAAAGARGTAPAQGRRTPPPVPPRPDLPPTRQSLITLKGQLPEGKRVEEAVSEGILLEVKYKQLQAAIKSRRGGGEAAEAWVKQSEALAKDLVRTAHAVKDGLQSVYDGMHGTPLSDDDMEALNAKIDGLIAASAALREEANKALSAPSEVPTAEAPKAPMAAPELLKSDEFRKVDAEVREQYPLAEDLLRELGHRKDTLAIGRDAHETRGLALQFANYTASRAANAAINARLRTVNPDRTAIQNAERAAHAAADIAVKFQRRELVNGQPIDPEAVIDAQMKALEAALVLEKQGITAKLAAPKGPESTVRRQSGPSGPVYKSIMADTNVKVQTERLKTLSQQQAVSFAKAHSHEIRGHLNTEVQTSDWKGTSLAKIYIYGCMHVAKMCEAVKVAEDLGLSDLAREVANVTRAQAQRLHNFHEVKDIDKKKQWMREFIDNEIGA